MNEDNDNELCTPEFSARHPATSAEGNEFVSRGALPTIRVLQPLEVKESIRTLHVKQRLVYDVVSNFAHQFLSGWKSSPSIVIVQGEAVKRS